MKELTTAKNKLMRLQNDKFTCYVYFDKNCEPVLVMALTVPTCEEFKIRKTWPGLYCLFTLIGIVLKNPTLEEPIKYSIDMVGERQSLLEKLTADLVCEVLKICTGVEQLKGVAKQGSDSMTRENKNAYLLMVYEEWKKYGIDRDNSGGRFVIGEDASVKLHSDNNVSLSYGGVRDNTYVFYSLVSIGDSYSTRALLTRNSDIISKTEYGNVFSAFLGGLELCGCGGVGDVVKDLGWLLFDSKATILHVAQFFYKANALERYLIEDMVDPSRSLAWGERVQAISDYLQLKLHHDPLGNFQLAAFCIRHNINLIMYEVDLRKLCHQPWIECNDMYKFVYNKDFVFIRILKEFSSKKEPVYRLLASVPVDEEIIE
jgi:hypothetical protein